MYDLDVFFVTESTDFMQRDLKLLRQYVGSMAGKCFVAVHFPGVF